VTVGLSGSFYYLDDKAAKESTYSINLDNLDVIDRLTNTLVIKKPSEKGLDGRDNPFAPF
jgi:hypothetical protein